MNYFKSPKSNYPPPRAFALVATISILTLAVMIAIALVSLANTSTKAQSSQYHLEIARANARMALTEAMAALQETMGPDQRICANAAILDTKPETPALEGVANPGWLGVWRSSVDTPTYEDGRETSFIGWLVSHPQNKDFNSGLEAEIPANSTIYFGEKRNNEDLGLRAEKINVDEGAFAWAVIDNSQKSNAKASEISVEPFSDFANRTTPLRHAVERVQNLESFKADSSQKIVSTDTVELALNEIPQDNFWKTQVTGETQHLITNVAHGGFKKDINTLLELDRDSTDWNALNLGVWDKDGFADNRDNYIYADITAKGATWAQMHSYYNLYKDVSWDSNSIAGNPSRPQLIDWHDADADIDFGDPTGGLLFPRLAKILYVYSYESAPTGQTVDGEEEYEILLVCNIFVALWNPYNVDINLPENCSPLIKLSSGVPLQFDWMVDSTSVGKAPFKKAWENSYQELKNKDKTEELYKHEYFYMYALLEKGENQRFHMQPGETLVFSMTDDKQVYKQGKYYMRSFKEGIDYSAGVKLNKVLPNGGAVKVKGSAKIQVGLETIDNMSARNNQGFHDSQYIDFWVYDKLKRWPYYEQRGKIHADVAVKYTDHMSVDASDATKQTASNLDGDRQPFAAFIMEMKTANDLDIEKSPNLPFIHSGITRLSSRLVNDKTAIVNERLQYQVQAMQSWDNDILQVSLSNNPMGANHIFIGGGNAQANGHTHVVAKGIPIMAPASLAEFQHAGLGDGADNIQATAGRYYVSSAPFYDLAVGNSYAHPLIDSDKDQTGNRNDHAYKINAILWDDFFCSSLAPRLSPMVEREQTIAEVWENFSLYNTPLTNSNYLLGDDYDNQRANSIIDAQGSLLPLAHTKLASYLSYSGGFNVNSVSVDAWRAFLSGAQNDNIKFYNLTNPNQLLGSEQLKDGEVPFCRTTLPCGPKIRENLNQNGAKTDYLGYRILSPYEIDSLAEEIVKQVKTRGPFLNMADFINRQLNPDDEALCLSGTLQAAIDATEINDDIKSAVEIDAGTIQKTGLDYPFKQAAFGNTAKGCPGWLMQGDLLVSLGSSIFVRGDTFTIRTYGESRDVNDDIKATAYIEATVQRTAEYLDKVNAPTEVDNLNDTNQTFGRRFKITQFRWLNQNEI